MYYYFSVFIRYVSLEFKFIIQFYLIHFFFHFQLLLLVTLYD